MSQKSPTASRRLALCGALVLVGMAALFAASRLRAAVKPAVKAEFPAEDYITDLDDPQLAKALTLVGKPMPALAVSGWVNGDVKPVDMKGKVVVLDLWATWCGPCVAAIPHNNTLWSTYKDQGLLVVGVCTSDAGQEKFPAAVEKYKIAYPACVDPDLKTESAYNVTFYPTYVAIDRKGVVRAVGLNPEKVEDVVKKLLAEKAG